jgi:hypothetical protein
MMTFTRIAAVVALGLSLGACERREGPVERTAEDAGRKVDKGAEETREAGERAGDRVEKGADETKREANEATK